MKRLIVLAAIGSLLTAPLASADPRHGPPPPYHRGPPAYNYGHYYGHYYPPYYRYGHDHHGDSDDEAAWAIGGLVLGAIIGSAAAKAEQREAQQAVPEASSTPLPPPQKRKVVTCYDEVAYDKEGQPYVARQCYENWR